MNQDEEFKQQIQANDAGERMSEFSQYKQWKDEHDPSKPLVKTFCPNCEKETACTHVAELYECDECGEDFAMYIVGRGEQSKSDVSVTESVLKDIKTPIPVEGNLIEVHELHFTEALRNLSKSRPADVSAIGVSILIDYVEELEQENKSIRHILSLWKKTEAMKEIERLESSLATLKEQTRWRKVEEELPEDRQNVEVLTKYGDPKTRKFIDDGDSKWWMHSDSNYSDELEYVTHWRPIDLPETDKEGEK